MAPRTTTRKARDIDYSNVGKTGRRTGITLKERKRDEHGFEIIDGSMFESPQKSPLKRNGVSSQGKGPSSESMDLQESSIPEPTEVLTGRKSLRNSDRPILPPPRSRSPIKTSLGSSPRRTPNIRSSVGRDALESEDTPSRTSLTGSKRLLDFSKVAPRLSVENSSPRTRARSGKDPLVNGSNLRVAETSDEIDEGYDPESMNMIGDGMGDVTKGFTNGDAIDDYDNGVMGDDPLSDPLVENVDPQSDPVEISIEEEAIPGVEDSQEVTEESFERQEEEEGEEDEEEGLFVSPEAKPQKRKAKKSLFTNARNRGQKRKSPPAEAELSAVTTKKGKGRPPLTSRDPDDSQLSTALKRAKGKGKASEAPVVYRDSDEEEEPQPTKKAKRGPKPKDPNAKMSVRQSKEVDEKVVEIRSRARPPRNLYILRRETPADDSVMHTRSGRVSVRPLAYWRNERCVYGDGEAADGERFPLATIKEVIRTEEVEAEPSKRGRKAKGRRRRVKEGSDEENDSEMEDWERDPGMMTGEVWRWEPQIQDSIEVSDTLDLAYAHGAIETREVKKSSFRYAKMLSTPFFGSGVVDLPPGSVKNPKNSRKMHMVFFIHTGRVVVTVNGTTFGVGMGGLWQVPRGVAAFGMVSVAARTATVLLELVAALAPYAPKHPETNRKQLRPRQTLFLKTLSWPNSGPNEEGLYPDSELIVAAIKF